MVSDKSGWESSRESLLTPTTTSDALSGALFFGRWGVSSVGVLLGRLLTLLLSGVTVTIFADLAG